MPRYVTPPETFKREAPVTPEEIELERAYCEEIQRRIVAYELDPNNFFKLNKRGRGRKI